MRTPSYLSPSSLALWESDREEFYLKHLAEHRPPKIAQTNYMAVGSAFDAYVKSALHEDIFGKGNDPKFEFEAIFNDQVEEQNRDFGIKAGKYIFDCYRLAGTYADLLEDLGKSEFAPQFEFRVDKTIEGVPLMGKPDCRYIHESGAHIILDWKVNGFCSKYGSTPYKFYSFIRDGWNLEAAKPSRNCDRPHPGYSAIVHNGVKIGRHYLEDSCKDWADQLSIYAWMLDEPIGSEDVIVCIDQIVCKRREDQFPLLRIANHRSRVSTAWQNQLVQRLTSCWKTIQSGYIFTDMPEEDSTARQEVLEMEAKTLSLNGSECSVEAWVSEVSRDKMGFRAR